MKRIIHKAAAAAAAAAALGTLLGSAAIAAPAAQLPPVQKAGPVEYMTGGIGKDEAAAIEHDSRQWPLTMEFAIKDKARAEFAADVAVEIRDANGKTVLEAKATGPFMLAKLAPGHYTVHARLAGMALQRKVEVSKGHHAKAVFLWLAGTDRPTS